MKQLVLTLIGKDQPGLVERVSSTILNHHGNWLTSNLSHLAGQFAGIVQVEVAEEHLQELQNAVLDISGLEVRIANGEQDQSTEPETLNLVITGNDRPGIVQELATVIRHKGANITHLNSKQQSAPNWGVPIFSAFATVSLPAGMIKDNVIEALEAITSDLIVDVEQS
ncbi:glycine cleavage system protein R [Pseudoalteromonas rubra]|jgi:glycine cleavage system regulatory protein|uniref:Glycine cleavage system transcriptional repressor n=1 Tax=Pseudoalteromonas rubra TaxID=43658 RepID=A0A5S3WU80_9GAMM|nr:MULTISPECIES: ACT domain-containing protein [Pseudoalteromonas]AZZ96996.1 glycine cleavage system protein R [Pseudoalteromonas sp. R3]MCO7189466.1 glycine cleavage system protein R [Pseudoalteromonas sp. XMcav2-N]TMP32378.1 glycine cleavage system protein R [Pseudoalteromonas rubra]TMP36374.1 glycine cleavage system protein R [Pseudoalteromonas rubra]